MPLSTRTAAVAAMLSATICLPGLAHEPPEAESQPRHTARLDIDTDPAVNPWTHLQFKNNPENFQFLIVSDRTGGERPGVFPDALRKARLLQPQFIMSVGDLIQGYTDDEAEVNRQWDEFEQFFDGFDIPFFYLPGNHDMSNPMMAKVWDRRFGRAYYHFVYRDVLFLCLNSEDGRNSQITDQQVAYFADVLQRHAEVRWTLVFLHKPLWTYDNGGPPGWHAVEQLLVGRRHTVFAGHYHTYTKHVRNNSRYIVLATTGGGSGLGGPDRGQFDHVMWLTMTDDGPVLANLMLDGIWDEDIFTTRTARLVQQLTSLQATPLIFHEDRRVTRCSFRLTNDEDIPMKVQARTKPHPLKQSWSLDAEVPPNSVSDFQIPLHLEANQINENTPPLGLSVVASFAPKDHRPMLIENDLRLAIERLRPMPRTKQTITVDGQLGEWSELEYSTTHFATDARSKGMPGTTPDGQARFAVAVDNSNLYLAVRVTDDKIITSDPPARRWQHDYVEVRINPRAFTNRTPFTQQWDDRSAIYLSCFPGKDAGTATLWRRQRYPEKLVVMQSPTETGYDLELAIPLDYLNARGDRAPADSLSLNITVVDVDAPDHEPRRQSWQPPWHLADAVLGGGSFSLPKSSQDRPG